MVSVYDSGALLAFCVTLAAVLGAVMGSFLHCAAWRIAHGESFLRGRSHCPSCGHVLGPLDLVPVFSWLLLRGKCRYCGAKVPARYLIAELLFAGLSVLCLLRFDLSVLCLRNYVFLCCLFCLSIVDLECYEIPDGCLIIAAVVWAAALPFADNPLRELGWGLLSGVVYGGGILAVSLLMDRVLKKESLGGGDVKLFAVVGLYLGLAGTLFAMLAACVFGLLFVLFGKKNNERQIPFGPSIAAAAALILLYGDRLIEWYLSIL